MAIQRTLLQIRKSLARKAGIDGPSGDTVSIDMTAEVLNEFINDALFETRDLLIGKWADYYTARATVAVVAGSDTYALPADFYKLRVVWIADGSGGYRRMHRADLDEAHVYTRQMASSSLDYRQRITNRNLVVMPVPAQAEELMVFYIPTPEELDSDADVAIFEVPTELKLLVSIAWRDCLDRQRIDPSPALAKIDAFTKQLRTAADALDAGEPFFLDPRQSHSNYMDDID